MRINNRIRSREVRVVGEAGEQLGVLVTPDALKKAEEAGLDLVEVATEQLDGSRPNRQCGQQEQQPVVVDAP